MAQSDRYGPMEKVVVQLFRNVSANMKLPSPYIVDTNPSYVIPENCMQLALAVATSPLKVKPLGYYRTPDGIDIYVFQCTLGLHLAGKKSWKIHRRYRHFDKYVSTLSELAPSLRTPSLSGAYFQVFRAKHCKDRLTELHSWLNKVITLTQSNYKDQKYQKIYSPYSDISSHAYPAILLASFIFAGANEPFSYFKGIPDFALTNHEINICLHDSHPLYPSRVKSNINTSSSENNSDSIGLGIRLSPNHTQNEQYYGAKVRQLTRDVDPSDQNTNPNLNLVKNIPVGAGLSCVNGISVENEEFDAILFHLRTLHRPLHLKFTFFPTDRKVNTNYECIEDMYGDNTRRLHRADSEIELINSKLPPTNHLLDVPVTKSGSMHVLSSVFSDVFIRKRANTVTRKRADTFRIDGDDKDNNIEDTEYDEMSSWDDVGGFFKDVETRGFLSFLKPATNQFADDKIECVWSSCNGPYSVVLGASKLRNRLAVIISTPPKEFLPKNSKFERSLQLEKGSVLIAVNNITTYGLDFNGVINLLMEATKPTKLVFRWFNEYSLYLGLPSPVDLTEESISQTESDNQNFSYDMQNEISSLAQAQTTLYADLETAYTENASLRVDMNITQESNQILMKENVQYKAQYAHIKMQYLNAQSQSLKYQDVIQQLTNELQQLQKEYNVQHEEFKHTKLLAQNAVQIAEKKANEYLLAQEERLILESNKSIENAKVATEKKAQYQVDEMIKKMKFRYEKHIEELVEGHGEDVELLSQQVSLWRHQVEVLTEKEKGLKIDKARISKMSDEDIFREMELDKEQDLRAGNRVRSSADELNIHKLSQSSLSTHSSTMPSTLQLIEEQNHIEKLEYDLNNPSISPDASVWNKILGKIVG